MHEYLFIRRNIVRNDPEAIGLFFSYVYIFPRPHWFLCLRLFRKTRRATIVFLAKIFTSTGSTRLFFKTTRLDESFLFRINGEGNWRNISTVFKNEAGLLMVRKQLPDKRRYEAEMKYYLKYKGSSELIRLPIMNFLEGLAIESQFIACPSFYKLMRERELSFEEAMLHFRMLKTELEKFYKTQRCRIHGDFRAMNILVDRGPRFYLIDYSESVIFKPGYDPYALLQDILAIYKIKEPDDISMHELGCSKKELDSYREYYMKKQAMKYASMTG